MRTSVERRAAAQSRAPGRTPAGQCWLSNHHVPRPCAARGHGGWIPAHVSSADTEAGSSQGSERVPRPPGPGARALSWEKLEGRAGTLASVETKLRRDPPHRTCSHPIGGKWSHGHVGTRGAGKCSPRWDPCSTPSPKGNSTLGGKGTGVCADFTPLKTPGSRAATGVSGFSWVLAGISYICRHGSPLPRPPSPEALSYLLNLITSFISFPVKFTSESAEQGKQAGSLIRNVNHGCLVCVCVFRRKRQSGKQQ